MYNWSKKKTIYFITNHCTETKLIPIIMDYCLLQFEALKFFLGVHLDMGYLPNFNFFIVNPLIFQLNRKIQRSTTCLETNFHNIFNISLKVTGRRNYSLCENLKGKFFLLNISDVNEI